MASASSESVIDKLTHASEGAIRAILLALCDDRRVKKRAANFLDSLERYQAASLETGTVTDVLILSKPNPRKRKADAADLRICVQCSGIFTDDDNEYGSCVYHSGTLELYDETRIRTEWEKPTPDELDTEANRNEFPEAFRWCCCENLGDFAGCCRGIHEANPDRSKKGRGYESPEWNRDRSSPAAEDKDHGHPPPLDDGLAREEAPGETGEVYDGGDHQGQREAQENPGNEAAEEDDVYDIITSIVGPDDQSVISSFQTVDSDKVDGDVRTGSGSSG